MTVERVCLIVLLGALLAAPAGADPFPSRYTAPESEPVLIRNATLLTGDGERLDEHDLLLRDGRIAAIGTALERPDGALEVDASGRWLTPGLIDVHSHLGNYPAPGGAALADGNELTSPNTAGVWAEHGIWPQDPQFPLALMGGVTTLHVLPGSGNLFGGRGVTLKNVPGRGVQDMKFPGAPHSLKMACGENPKRVYGSRNQMPGSRMGNLFGQRNAWIQAHGYARKLEEYRRAVADGEEATPPERDLTLETLSSVLAGEILVHNHCYRADEMMLMLDVAREFDYRIAAFHHATEAYKIADVLAEEGVCAAVWADWWGFKIEAMDAIEANAALVHAAEGGCAIIHSDSPRDIQRLNQEAAKAMAAGRRMGLDLEEASVMRWLTGNAAKVLGIAEETGTLREGLAADVVLWSGNPFSVYTRADMVWIDGALRFHRGDEDSRWRTDFDLGLTPAGRREGVR